ncbi:unnamed protein product, partial [Amoebophrya sp. A25]
GSAGKTAGAPGFGPGSGKKRLSCGSGSTPGRPITPSPQRKRGPGLVKIRGSQKKIRNIKIGGGTSSSAGAGGSATSTSGSSTTTTTTHNTGANANFCASTTCTATGSATTGGNRRSSAKISTAARMSGFGGSPGDNRRLSTTSTT